MHGYEIAQVVQGDEALRVIWRIERSEIYFLLGKLSKGGLIVERAAEQAGGPVRVIYAPT
jgi:DNA-binding PadR family transcriptional regulator